jgi:hypothetical protein
MVRARSHVSVDATVRTVRHLVRKSQVGVREDAQGKTVRHPVQYSEVEISPPLSESGQN